MGQAATHYAGQLLELSSSVLPRTADGALPRVDLVLLGVGPDGHVASLFPNAKETAATGELGGRGHGGRQRGARPGMLEAGLGAGSAPMRACLLSPPVPPLRTPPLRRLSPSLTPKLPRRCRTAEGWVLPVSNSPKPPAERITLTLPVINAAQQVAIVALGKVRQGQGPHMQGQLRCMRAGRTGAACPTLAPRVSLRMSAAAPHMPAATPRCARPTSRSRAPLPPPPPQTGQGRGGAARPRGAVAAGRAAGAAGAAYQR